jgi:cobyric acid synthase
MEVLAEWERQLVAGFLVNKFRGQSSLLASAHDYVKMHTGRDVFGVIPYISNLGLPEEDSVSFKKGSFNCVKSSSEGVEIAVISIPHISNFTDVEPFLNEPDVTLRIIEEAADLGTPQAIILPGSKNVISDLAFLKSSGFVSEIDRCIEDGCEVVGICGGYQMLGKAIKDPFEIESTDGKVLSGLSYLNIETVIEQNKRLTRKEGVHSPSGKSIFGYEIHHGVSTTDSAPLVSFNDGSTCGSMDRSKQIWGSYLHGIFDGDAFRRWFIDRLRSNVGISPVGEIVAPYDLEEAFDRLAACLRENVDMNRIYNIMGL